MTWVEIDKDVTQDHRYMLWRGATKGGRRAAVIQLNPSDAGDAVVVGKRDPTVVIVDRWARLHGYDSVIYLNLFAWRHGDQAELGVCITSEGCDFAVGERNDDALLEWTDGADVIAAWGDAEKVPAQGQVAARRAEVLGLLGCDLLRVGRLTKKGNPQHGRRWNFDPEPQLWRRAGAFQ